MLDLVHRQSLAATDPARAFDVAAGLAWLRARAPGVTVLKPLERLAVGAELWLRWDALVILPVALGLSVRAVDAPRSIDFAMIHGPFARFDYSITIDAGTRGPIDVEYRVRCALPWFLGGATMERLAVKPEVEKLFSLAGKAHPRA